MKIPAGPEALTATWLTAALRQGGAIVRARVTAFHLTELERAKGFVGRLVRLRLAYDPDEETAPRSLVAKFSSADAGLRARFAGRYQREVRFYQHLAGCIPLRTPRCYYADVCAETGEHILLLEDMAPARDGDLAAGCSVREAQLAIREIARFHAAGWQKPGPDWLPRSAAPAAYRGLEEAYQERWGPFLADVAPALPDAARAAGERLGPRLEQILSRAYQGSPWALTHGDYHADNLFFSPQDECGEEQVAVVDWQSLGYGLGMLDVGLFLGSSLPPADRRAWEMGLLELYQATLSKCGVQGYGPARCLDDYRLVMLVILASLVFDIGGNTFADERVKRKQMEVVLPRCAAAIADLDAGAL